MKSVQEFVSRYPPAPPRRTAANEDEQRYLDADDGVLELSVSTTQTAIPGAPDDRATRHLWVIWAEGIPYIHELAPKVRPPLTTGVAKHSNLTGGAPASCGGELWVDRITPSKLYINGASGRYGPRTPQQLEDTGSLFRALGFEVESYGWDYDVNLPARVLRR